MIDRCGIIDIIMALVTSIVLLLAFTVAAGDDIPPYSTKYFSQYINHFDFSNSDKFQQKVLVMQKYWKDDVILFYPGNEAPIEEFYQMTGFIFELAQYTNALVIFAEHRYYGDSLPFGKDSFTPENIKYLTSEQAMADFAILVKWLKNKEGLKKAVVIGGSYGGMLAAWLRLKYPNVFVGALAASAPIYLATGVDIPSGAFYQKVTESFMKADPTCPGLVQSAFVQLNTLADKELFDDITKSFKLCKPITQEKINDLIGWVRTSFCTLAMENFPYPAPPFPANPVLKACQILTSSSDLLGGLADAAGLAYNGSGNLPCYNLDDEYVECADASGCGAGPASVSWDYQSCSEFKFLITTNNQTDMFPPYSLDHSEYCHSQWDLPYTWRGDWVGLSFWINDMSAASNIIFSNGDLDPWSVGGVNSSISDSLIAITIEGGAHHLDLRSSNPSDPASVVNARELEKQTIKKWIGTE